MTEKENNFDEKMWYRTWRHLRSKYKVKRLNETTWWIGISDDFEMWYEPKKLEAYFIKCGYGVLKEVAIENLFDEINHYKELSCLEHMLQQLEEHDGDIAGFRG